MQASSLRISQQAGLHLWSSHTSNMNQLRRG